MESEREEEIIHPLHNHRAIPLDEFTELSNHLRSMHINNETRNPFRLARDHPVTSMNRSPRSVLSFNGIVNANPNMGFLHSSISNGGYANPNVGFISPSTHWHSNALNLSNVQSPSLLLSIARRLRVIYSLAKDYRGYRFLQGKLSEGRHNVDLIFEGVIGHLAELMMHPYGNYLMQKLFEFCTEEQTMMILFLLTNDLSTFFTVCLDSHGTRSVQKLIETLGTPHQITRFMAALLPWLVQLMMDIHGNHVIQHCLTYFRTEDIQFIFKAATAHCVEIAAHQYGCVFLQRLIGCSTAQHRENLVEKISSSGIQLAQDLFGNYVVQYIIGLKSPSANEFLASLFERNYVQLSMQKFSSNVVEKCLKEFGENSKAAIVHELLSVPRFDQLLQHEYANFVIKSALLNTRGAPYAALVDAIRPHAQILRTSQYCKQIYQVLSKKSSGF